MTSIRTNTGYLEILQEGNETNSWSFRRTTNSILQKITNFPLKIENTDLSKYLVVKIKSDLILTDINHYIELNSSFIIIDGENNTITANFNTQFARGFFQSVKNTSNISIQNLKYSHIKGTLVKHHGWFLADRFGENTNNMNINNLINYAPINNESCGGIGGSSLGTSSDNFIISDCTNFGNMGFKNSGGMGAIYCFAKARDVTVERCKNFGSISYLSGGLFSSTDMVFERFDCTECINYGIIKDRWATGLFTIKNLTNSENNSSIYRIEKCMNTSDINYEYSSGLLNVYLFKNELNIVNSYSNSKITSKNSAGLLLVAQSAENSVIKMENSFYNGSIDNSDSAGILNIKYLYFDTVNLFGFKVNIQKLPTNFSNVKTFLTDVYSVNSNTMYRANNIFINTTNTRTVLQNCVSEPLWTNRTANTVIKYVYPFNQNIKETVWASENPNIDAPFKLVNGNIYDDRTINYRNSTLTISPNHRVLLDNLSEYRESIGIIKYSPTYSLLTPSSSIGLNDDADLFVYTAEISLKKNTKEHLIVCNNISEKIYVLDIVYLHIVDITDNYLLLYENENKNWFVEKNDTVTEIKAFPYNILNESNPISTMYVYITSNLTITSLNQYFKIMSPNVIIDGNDFNLVFDFDKGASVVGIFQNGSINEDGHDNITIKNINCINNSQNVNILQDEGWILQKYFAKNASNNHIISVSNYADVNTSFAGGIAGVDVGLGATNLIFENCRNYGNINGLNCAGFCPRIGSAPNSSTLFKNCKNFGNLLQVKTSGFVYNIISDSFVTFSLCDSFGKITAGEQSGYVTSDNSCKIVINKCTFKSDIVTTTGSVSGFCRINANNIDVSISNSNFYGNIISGSAFVYDEESTTGSITLSNCYYYGFFEATNSPIFVFTNPNPSTVAFSNCFGVNQKNAGSILLVNRENVTITNCILSNGEWSANKNNSPLLMSTGDEINDKIWIEVDPSLPFLLYKNNSTIIYNLDSTTKYKQIAPSMNYLDDYPSGKYSIINGEQDKYNMNNESGQIDFLVDSAELTEPPTTYVLHEVGNYQNLNILTVATDKALINNTFSLTIYGAGNQNSEWWCLTDTRRKITNFPVTISSLIQQTVISNYKYIDIKLTWDLYITQANQYFIIDLENIIFDGNGFNINSAVVENYLGLFQNGTSTQNGKNNVTVRNIVFTKKTGAPPSLITEAGWVFHRYYGKGTNNNRLENIINYNDVNTARCGGIAGRYFGHNANNFVLKNCINYGFLNKEQNGGVSAEEAFVNADNISVEGCYNFGTLYKKLSAGLFASIDQLNGQMIVSNCGNFGRMFESDCNGFFLLTNAARNTNIVSRILLTKCRQIFFQASSNCAGFITMFNIVNRIELRINDSFSTGSVGAYSAGFIRYIINQKNMNGTGSVEINNSYFHSISAISTSGGAGFFLYTNVNNFNNVDFNLVNIYSVASNNRKGGLYRNNRVLIWNKAYIQNRNNLRGTNNGIDSSWKDANAQKFLNGFYSLFGNVTRTHWYLTQSQPNKPFEMINQPDMYQLSKPPISVNPLYKNSFKNGKYYVLDGFFNINESTGLIQSESSNDSALFGLVKHEFTTESSSGDIQILNNLYMMNNSEFYTNKFIYLRSNWRIHFGNNVEIAVQYPLNIPAGFTLLFDENFGLSHGRRDTLFILRPENYFILNDNVFVDGKFFRVNSHINFFRNGNGQWQRPGLFKIAGDNITIQNIIFRNDERSVTLKQLDGYCVQSDVTYSNLRLNNIVNWGWCSNSNGGVVGYNFGGTNHIIENCINYGHISNFSAGIIGCVKKKVSYGQIVVRDCSSYGLLNEFCAGICNVESSGLNDVVLERCICHQTISWHPDGWRKAIGQICQLFGKTNTAQMTMIECITGGVGDYDTPPTDITPYPLGALLLYNERLSSYSKSVRKVSFTFTKCLAYRLTGFYYNTKPGGLESVYTNNHKNNVFGTHSYITEKANNYKNELSLKNLIQINIEQTPEEKAEELEKRIVDVMNNVPENMRTIYTDYIEKVSYLKMLDSKLKNYLDTITIVNKSNAYIDQIKLFTNTNASVSAVEFIIFMQSSFTNTHIKTRLNDLINVSASELYNSAEFCDYIWSLITDDEMKQHFAGDFDNTQNNINTKIQKVVDFIKNINDKITYIQNRLASSSNSFETMYDAISDVIEYFQEGAVLKYDLSMFVTDTTAALVKFLKLKYVLETNIFSHYHGLMVSFMDALVNMKLPDFNFTSVEFWLNLFLKISVKFKVITKTFMMVLDIFIPFIKLAISYILDYIESKKKKYTYYIYGDIKVISCYFNHIAALANNLNRNHIINLSRIKIYYLGGKQDQHMTPGNYVYHKLTPNNYANYRQWNSTHVRNSIDTIFINDSVWNIIDNYDNYNKYNWTLVKRVVYKHSYYNYFGNLIIDTYYLTMINTTRFIVPTYVKKNNTTYTLSDLYLRVYFNGTFKILQVMNKDKTIIKEHNIIINQNTGELTNVNPNLIIQVEQMYVLDRWVNNIVRWLVIHLVS